MGKAYANRKPIEERPESDFYRTPASLTHLLEKTGLLPHIIYEPMAGDNAMVDVLREYGHYVEVDDIRTTGKDFLDFQEKVPYIATNPAFSIFTETVSKCQEVCTDGFALLGKVNFFGAHSRVVQGTWGHLKHVYIFDRQVDYRSPATDDGSFCVGNLITGWFIWDMDWDNDYWYTHVLDVQKWATLGSYDKLGVK